MAPSARACGLAVVLRGAGPSSLTRGRLLARRATYLHLCPLRAQPISEVAVRDPPRWRPPAAPPCRSRGRSPSAIARWPPLPVHASARSATRASLPRLRSGLANRRGTAALGASAARPVPGCGSRPPAACSRLTIRRRRDTWCKAPLCPMPPCVVVVVVGSWGLG